MCFREDTSHGEVDVSANAAIANGCTRELRRGDGMARPFAKWFRRKCDNAGMRCEWFVGPRVLASVVRHGEHRVGQCWVAMAHH